MRMSWDETFGSVRLLTGLVSIGLLSACAASPSSTTNASSSPLQLATTHPSVLAARERIVQARERETIARADILPEANLTASQTTYLQDVTSGTARQSAQSLGVSVSVPLTRALAGANGAQAAHFATRAEGEALRGITDQMLVELARTKSGLQRTTKTATIRGAHKNELNSFLTQQKQRHKAGEVPASELENIRARIKFVEGELSRLRSETASYAAKLKGLAGDIPLNEIQLLDLARFVPSSAQKAVAVAMSRNPSLREAGLRQNAASQDVAKAANGLLPDLSLSVNTSLYDERYVGGTSDASNSTNVKLDLKVPLFDGGRRFAEVKVRQSLLREQAYMAQAQMRTTESDASAQWQGVMGAREMRTLAAERIKKSRNALAGALEAERVGARSVDQVLSAYENVMEARIASVEAESQVFIRTHELMATLGFLGEAYSSK